MKFFPLLWSNLMRRKVRTLCTGLSIFIAFVLIGALISTRGGFSRGVDLTGTDRLVVSHKNAFNQPMPLAYGDRLAAIPGVAAVSYVAWFPGVYQDPRNDFPKLAVDADTWFEMYGDLWTVPADHLLRWKADRTGAIVGQDLAERFGWTVGSRVPITGTMWPKRGGGAWEFTVDGIYGAGPAAGRNASLDLMFFHYTYFNDTRAVGQDFVDSYRVRVSDPRHANEIAEVDAVQQLGNLTTGQSVQWGGSRWDVVGVFQGDGGNVESEVWCDVEMLQQAFRRQNAFQAVYAKLESPESLDVLRSALANDPRLEVDIRRESEYYADQSRTLTTLITTAGVFIAVLMGAGAIFAAVSTMYASVVSRTREIATLRAIGFGSTAVVWSVLAEALALASVGGAIGALVAWLLFDGYAVSTLKFQSMSQVAFAFAVTPLLVVQGMAYAIGMGLTGAMWPAWRAARLPIVSALRDE